MKCEFRPDTVNSYYQQRITSTAMEHQKDTTPPKDKFLLAYILFYALGTVTMIPSSFFTTATDYWMYKFRDPDSNQPYNSKNRTGLQSEFTADYSIVSHVSNAVFIILTIVWIRKLNILLRTLGTLSGTIAVFVFTCVFVKVDTDSWQTGFMVVTLLSGFILTACSGIFMVTLVEIAAKFPPSYIALFFTGQAICGILAAVAQVISLSIDGGPADNGFVYFLTGMSFVVLTLLAFLLSIKTSVFFKYYFWKELKVEKVDWAKDKLWVVFQKIKYYLLAMAVTSGTSVMVHPGLTALVFSVDKGNGNRWNDVYFTPVISFLVYCIVDYIGRESAMILKKPSNGLVLLVTGLIRVSFIPLLMYCNAQPRHRLSVAFDEDYVYIIFIIIFAASNGFLVNLCVLQVAQIPTEKEKPLAFAFIMVFMIIGMALLSFVSSAIINAL